MGNWGEYLVSQKALGGPRGGGTALGGHPFPSIVATTVEEFTAAPRWLFWHLGTGKESRRGAGTEQGLGRKEKRWSLSSGCSQLQRTEGYTKQAPPQPAPHSCSPPLNVHKLHSTCPWFGTKCSATGTECGYQVPLLSQMGLEARRGERVQQRHLLAARAT